MSAEEKLIDLYTKQFGHAPAKVIPIAGAGSNRRYFRMVAIETTAAPMSVVGTFGTDANENNTFIALARHFSQKGLSVPQIIAVSPDRMCYLQTDLGDVSLFSVITGALSSLRNREALNSLEKAMRMLARVQHFGSEGLDWNLCSPEAMDSRMIRWDLNYFKYCFLKQCRMEFSETLLEDEFDSLHSSLMQRVNGSATFMIRDFQSRNVMLANGEPFLIDFQGGRRGPVEYDVASFLWQAKAGITKDTRDRLIECYLQTATVINPTFDKQTFRESLPFFVLFRILQTLGAYGYRGLYEGKSHFIASIPKAVSNLNAHLVEYGLDKQFPYLTELASQLKSSAITRTIEGLLSIGDFEGLTVTVTSFSYKQGIPSDYSGNGGGFVFDCRAVHNPGRYEQYRHLTGRDTEVKFFLEENGEITTFLQNVWGLTDSSISRYIQRGFKSLCVSFGCTGGRHRSVYAAEATATHISEVFPRVRVVLYHREQGIFEINSPSA